MLPWQPNKMATGHQTHELDGQSSNDHNLQNMVHITLLVMEKMQLNHFPIISLWELSVAMATKPKDRSPQFQLFSIALTQATFVPNYNSTASVVLKLSLKNSFFKI